MYLSPAEQHKYWTTGILPYLNTNPRIVLDERNSQSYFQPTYYPSINAVMESEAFKSYLVYPYVDPDITVLLSVADKKIEVKAAMFAKHPTTYLGEKFTSAGEIPKHLYLDCDPDVFSVVINWYRYGNIYLPNNMSIEMFLHHIKLFKLPKAVILKLEKDAVQRNSQRFGSLPSSSHSASATD
jgi:hypothetical protein